MDFESKIRKNKLGELKCPDPECRKVVPGAKVRRLLSEEWQKMYGSILVPSEC
jgi:hypothetical protein